MATEKLETQDLEEGDVDETTEQVASTTEVDSPEEPDYKALWKESEAARQKTERDARTQRIDHLTQQQRDRRLDMTIALQEAILKRLEEGELTRGEAKAELRKGTVAIEEQFSDPAQEVGVVEGFTSVFAAVNKLKLSDEELATIASSYEPGRQALQAGNTELAQAYLRSAETALELVKERRGGKSPSAAAMALNSRTGQRAAGPSDQDWLDRYADEENGGIPATPENTNKARELRAKGLRPRLLKR